jgi:hypothetical protein
VPETSRNPKVCQSQHSLNISFQISGLGTLNCCGKKNIVSIAFLVHVLYTNQSKVLLPLGEKEKKIDKERSEVLIV